MRKFALSVVLKCLWVIANALIVISLTAETNMPRGSKVHRCFTKLRRGGASKAKAAKVCQKSTGQSLKTGRKPKRKKGG